MSKKVKMNTRAQGKAIAERIYAEEKAKREAKSKVVVYTGKSSLGVVYDLISTKGQ